MREPIYLKEVVKLKALAHPLRARILGVLRLEGPATATTLGARLGESTGSMSYHLRQLERHGFVEDAPGLGKGRERWWRAAHDVTVLSMADFAEGEGREAADLLRRQGLAYQQQVIDNYIEHELEWGRQWMEAVALDDALIHLTPEGLARLNEKIRDLMTEADEGPDSGATPVVVLYNAVPTRPEELL